MKHTCKGTADKLNLIQWGRVSPTKERSARTRNCLLNCKICTMRADLIILSDGVASGSAPPSSATFVSHYSHGNISRHGIYGIISPLAIELDLKVGKGQASHMNLGKVDLI